MNMMSVLNLKPALDHLVNVEDGDNWTSRMITVGEWKLIKGAVEALEHVLLVTKTWEVEVVPTINSVIEQIFTLNSKLQTFISDPQKNRLNIKLLVFYENLVHCWSLKNIKSI